MSIHLFNAMIDLVLASLGLEFGMEIGGVRVNHNVFTDHCVNHKLRSWTSGTGLRSGPPAHAVWTGT